MISVFRTVEGVMERDCQLWGMGWFIPVSYCCSCTAGCCRLRVGPSGSVLGKLGCIESDPQLWRQRVCNTITESIYQGDFFQRPDEVFYDINWSVLVYIYREMLASNHWNWCAGDCGSAVLASSSATSAATSAALVAPGSAIAATAASSASAAMSAASAQPLLLSPALIYLPPSSSNGMKLLKQSIAIAAVISNHGYLPALSHD